MSESAPTKRAARNTHRTETVARVREYLEANPRSTRYDLEVALGVQQQRISEALRLVDARIVGLRPPPDLRAGRGCRRPAPEYCLPDQDPNAGQITVSQDVAKQMARVSSIFDMGARIRSGL